MSKRTVHQLRRLAPWGRRLLRPVVGLPLLLLALLAAGPSHADPDYGRGPILYGLDPVLRATEDPRLLGVERLVLRRRLVDMGVDPVRRPDLRPGLSASFAKHMTDKARVDLIRREYLVEYNGPLGVMTEFRYPTFFYLFPTSETLPGGFTYFPARPVGDPLVEVFVDEVERGARRRHEVGQRLVRTRKLDVAGSGRTGKDDDGLINLTIPIKLPRTLEKIIGRGEKTRIKITGREHLAITGESTVVKPFVPNERVQSQSLFPTLDMEQELQINLSGTIGEKIIIEVDHNSAAIGPEATKIRLMYQGDEDEIIKTIETGDVGLTLPGSQLLGYNSNKSGLFGVKVTGQLGRADFTAVASKQKAESSAKTFNASGGQVSDHVISSADYINNRFFRLDDPANELFGRRGTERIDVSTVKIFRAMGPGQLVEGDVQNVAAYIDRTGFRAWPGLAFADSAAAVGQRWRPITDFDVLLNVAGGLEAIDLRNSQPDADIIAVTYLVTDTDGNSYRVGDDPSAGAATQPITGQEGRFYRMKAIKLPQNDTDAKVFGYVMRNIYSLGGANIDPSTFSLRIEIDDNSVDQPAFDRNDFDYVRIFGLDTRRQDGTEGADGLIDLNDPLLFDLDRGLLKFPLDFPEPFDADPAVYEANYNTFKKPEEAAFVYTDSYMQDFMSPQLYSIANTSDYRNFGKFKIISSHASAASSFSLGASNIEEGSEVVTLNGRTLTKGTDYEIDYTFGDLQLKGDAASLAPEDKIAVTYSYSPFFGGGNTSLMGLNLGYDLGRDSKFATTWLYQTEAIVGEKAKLGEEPSKNLVGNMNLQHTFRPYFLTHVANFLSRKNTERESSLQFNGEMAISLPNPNTKGRVFLEDFEGVDASDQISLSRIGWTWASRPFVGAGQNDSRVFSPQARTDHVRWFLPKERTLRRYLNPDLVNQERDETQPTMDMYLREDDGWTAESWGGIMRGLSRTGLDLSKSQFVEIWINDRQPDPANRRGRVHIDFGYIDEDGFWPLRGDSLEVGTEQLEDTNRDAVWTYEEDIGLDGRGDTGPQRFDASYEVDGDSPYPFINGTARNNREDAEDIDGDTLFDRRNGFFTVTIDLATTEPLVDVVQDYDDVQDLVDQRISWRKYRIPLAAVDSAGTDIAPNIKAVTHARIWYEDGDPARPVGQDEVYLQFSEFRFLGSRWEREGVRRIDDEVLLSQGERLPDEGFFLGEVNNKENPDYRPPFTVEEVNNIPEKEQSLVLNFADIEQGHMVRASKQVSSQGDDYTTYRDISWYWNNTDHANADLDLFFRVGSDTLNYYEVTYRYADSARKTGWHQVTLNLAELSNTKNGQLNDDGSVSDRIGDVRTADSYDVRVVGRPDLRRVRRYYFGVANRAQSIPATGTIYLNDVRLEGVKRDKGLAQRVGLRLNMADVIKSDFDWRYTDAEYHGLDKNTGSGINYEDWSLNTSLSVDDFVPLLGFKLPVNVSRRRVTQRPKYETNSDIEILDENVRAEESTLETQERFSTRLSHTPSKSPVLRYAIDPWVLSLNGSRTRKSSPLDRSFNKSLSGSVNYDLRITGQYVLGRFPGLNYVPLLRGLSFVPRKVAFGASFTATENQSVSIAQDGTETPRANTKTRPATFTANVDYQPLTIVDLSAGGRSERDLLRPSDKFGVNIGTENKRSYDLRMTFVPPKPASIPGGPIFMPVRAVVRGIGALRPSVQFTGSFADVHDPAIRQPNDPTNIRSVSNSGKWDFRMDLPWGDVFKKTFPERKYSQNERERLVQQQRAREEQQARRNRQPTVKDQGDQQEPGAVPLPGEEDLTPEERRRREEERLLQAAEEQRELEREQGLIQEPAPVDAGGPGINPLAIFNPFLNTLRNLTPLKVTYSRDRSSSYARLLKTADFWYKTGLVNNLDVTADDYASGAATERDNLSLSTTSQVSRNLTLDVKYSNTTGLRDQVGSITETYKQDWPDAQISLNGLERWGVFGADPDDRESGWFKNSNINLSYKQSKSVDNYTALSYNPKYSTTISPRWQMTFQSGMTATLNATLAQDRSLSNGVTTRGNRNRFGLNLRHQFRADAFLAKLGLYRPGSSQAISMDVDMSYQTDRSERINANGTPSTPTGTTRYSLGPRFSVQVTRSLNTAMRFIFSRSNNIASGQTTTSLGLGVEATFVF
ncbi:hypothetical protein KDM41_10525 [bacterium]|nr:hypothetical protein [bacterium]